MHINELCLKLISFSIFFFRPIPNTKTFIIKTKNGIYQPDHFIAAIPYSDLRSGPEKILNIIIVYGDDFKDIDRGNIFLKKKTNNLIERFH